MAAYISWSYSSVHRAHVGFITEERGLEKTGLGFSAFSKVAKSDPKSSFSFLKWTRMSTCCDYSFTLSVMFSLSEIIWMCSLSPLSRSLSLARVTKRRIVFLTYSPETWLACLNEQGPVFVLAQWYSLLYADKRLACYSIEVSKCAVEQSACVSLFQLNHTLARLSTGFPWDALAGPSWSKGGSCSFLDDHVFSL